ncbi:MAG TPA: response regulator [Polyangiaceae bacterium]|nr:response regulator [Polyangiaceae bacterium]
MTNIFPSRRAPVPREQRPLKVLLVDDDMLLLRTTQRLLARDGYDVVTCGSGAEALIRVAAHAFDVVISDLDMPLIGGLKLLRALREREPELPVLLMTGRPEVESAASAIEHGALQYLIKPVAPERLVQAIEAAAHARRQHTVVDSPDAREESWTTRAIVRPDGSLFGHELRSTCERGPSDFSRLAAHLQELAHDAPLPCFIRHQTLDFAQAPHPALGPLANRIVIQLSDLSLSTLDDARHQAARLRQLGFRLCLDQLGTGYGTLTTFTALEPEFVKLAPSLVTDIHLSATKQKVVASLITLAHEMEQSVIADGLLAEEDKATLVVLGCQLLQGPLVGAEAALLSH